MSKRTHQNEDDDGVKMPRQGGTHETEVRQDGAGAVQGGEIPQPQLQHPQPQKHDPIRKDQQIEINEYAQPNAKGHKQILVHDNVVITDSDTDNPETIALKNLTRQVLQDKKTLMDSLLDKNRFIDAKKVDNERLIREKEDLNRQIESLTIQMQNIVAHSSESEKEEKKIIRPDKAFKESINPPKSKSYELSVMDRARQMVDEHIREQDYIKTLNLERAPQPPTTPLIEEEPYRSVSFLEHRQKQRHYSTESSQPNYSEEIRHKPKPAIPRIITIDDDNEDMSTITTFDVDDWRRVEMKTPQQDQLAIKEKQVRTQDCSLEQQNLFMRIVEKLQQQKQVAPGQSLELDSLITMAKQTMIEQKKQTEKMKKEIKKSKQVATYYSHTLVKPTIYEFVDFNIKGTQEALQAKNIKAVIDSFDPDKNPEQDFGAVWRKILLHTNNLRLDEKAYKDILTVVVQGTAAHVLFEMVMEDKPLNHILQTFSDLYAKSKTIVDHVTDLNNFKRKPSEPIATAMRRARVMAERVRHLWPQAVWENGKRLEILTSILKQIISTKTKQHLEYEEMKYLKNGTILEYKAVLDIVETFETINNQIPTGEGLLTINVCTGVPKSNTQNDDKISLLMDDIKELQVMKFNPTQKKGKNSKQQKINEVRKTLKILGLEPINSKGKYKPTTHFPPRSDRGQSPYKKSRDNSSEHRTTKPATTEDNRLIRKAVRPSERRSRIDSMSRDHSIDSRQTSKGKSPTSNTQIRHPYQSPKKVSDQQYDKQDYLEKNRQSWISFKNKQGQRRRYSPKRYGFNKYPNTYKRDNNYNHTYKNKRPYYSSSFSQYRDNGEQKQHYKEWQSRDRTHMYQCKSCRTIHVLNSFCPNTGEQVLDNIVQPLN